MADPSLIIQIVYQTQKLRRFLSMLLRWFKDKKLVQSTDNRQATKQQQKEHKEGEFQFNTKRQHVMTNACNYR